jgi:hypothetical protein
VTRFVGVRLPDRRGIFAVLRSESGVFGCETLIRGEGEFESDDGKGGVCNGPLLSTSKQISSRKSDR